MSVAACRHYGAL